MSEVINNIKTRRAVRKYKEDMVPKEIIQQIVEAGTYAPTGRNMQSPIIIAVTNKEMRDRMSELNAKVAETSSDPFYGAPVVLVVLADKSKPCYQYDGTLVMGNLMLAAHDLGIGSCWIHRAKEVFEQPQWQEWLKSLGVDGEYEGIGNCVLGYVDGEYPVAPLRKENRVFYVGN